MTTIAARLARHVRDLFEPITSRLRERRILRYCREATGHMRAGRSVDGRVAFNRMKIEVNRRTPRQIARMERARNLARKSEA
jgi:hypothetical protein